MTRTTSEPVCLISVGATAREIVRRSRTVESHPRAIHLHVDTDAAGCQDDDSLHMPAPDEQEIDLERLFRPGIYEFKRSDHVYRRSAAGATSVPEAFLAGVRDYERLFQWLRTALLGLAGGGGAASVHVFSVAGTEQATGAGLLPAVLQALQRIRRERRAAGAELVRHLLLTRPVVGDGRHEMLDRSTAALATLEAAWRFGVQVAPGQVLEAPIAEYAFLLGQGRGIPRQRDQRLDRAGAILGALADAGPMGRGVRMVLAEHAAADPRGRESRVFKAVGLGSMVLDHGQTVDLLTDLLVSEADQAGSEAAP